MKPSQHHRSTWLRQSNKPHKSAHRSNRMLTRAQGGRMRAASASSAASSRANIHLNRIARGNQAHLRRKAKRLATVAKRRLASAPLSSASTAPRIIAIIPLAPHADPASFARTLKATSTTRLSLILPHRSPLSVLDAAKVADILCFILPVGGEEMAMEMGMEMGMEMEKEKAGGRRAALERYLCGAVDREGREAMALCKNQGLPAVVGCVQHLDRVAKKHRAAVKRHAALFFEEEFGAGVKVMRADEENDACLRNAVQRCFVHAPLKLISWRAERAYMLVDAVDSGEQGEVALRGFLRGAPIGIHQLFHVTGQGSFQIARIERCEDPDGISGKRRRRSNKGKKCAAMDVDEAGKDKVLAKADPAKMLSLEEEATPDLMAGEQTWPTEDEMQDAPEGAKQLGAASKLEDKGMNKDGSSSAKKREAYQAAWLPEDDSDVEGLETLEESGGGGEAAAARLEELVNEWKQRRMEERDEVMFPDEVEVPLETPARERFAKYRGLKSFRQSPWHPHESLPAEYAYIHQLQDYSLLRNAAVAHTRKVQQEWLHHLDTAAPDADPIFHLDGEAYICPGAYIRVVLANVQPAAAEALCTAAANSKAPMVAGALLAHEQKLTVVNCNVRRVAEYEEPVKAREELTMQCGFWRRPVRPTFSENSLNCDKHKADRYLQHGRWTVASVYAPITMGTNVPTMLLATKQGEGVDKQVSLVAAGSLLDANANRVVVKKAVLTGYPVRIKKRKAVVRFMFHNPEDVKWFKPVELWTKYGAAGRIVDSVGTHGLFKASFDRVMKSNDTICMSLYKRIFPKPVNEFKSLRTQH